MEKTKTYIAKVRINKANGQRTVTIPKEAVDIREYVEVKNHELSLFQTSQKNKRQVTKHGR